MKKKGMEINKRVKGPGNNEGGIKKRGRKRCSILSEEKILF